MLIITDAENITAFLDMYISRSLPPPQSSLVYVENRPAPLRCVAVGGQPPPAVTVQLLPPVTSGLPVRPLDLAESWWVTVGGRPGLRVVRKVTERGTKTFRTTTHDDGAEIGCSAVVNGLPTRTTTVKLIVHCTFSVTLSISLLCRFFPAYVFVTRECDMVILSVASVCVFVCLSRWGSNV